MICVVRTGDLYRVLGVREEDVIAWLSAYFSEAGIFGISQIAQSHRH
jgi:hypothetical protein